MDWHSLVENLKTEKEPEKRAIVSILNDIKGDNPSAMIREGLYKLVYHSGYDYPQLLDMEKDPHENKDLATVSVRRTTH
jgi:hypothetical protein